MSDVSRLFARKPIAELLVEGESPYALKRALGAGDLVMLAIGAVIGAGIFGAIGTAAAGQYDAAGHLVRSGAGPALVLSFLLLGVACGTIGGYPHVAHVISADLDRVGQLRSGDTIELRRIDLDEARRIDEAERKLRSERLQCVRVLAGDEMA